MIASTLDDRAAFDAKLSGGSGLRDDDAAGQAAMRACLAGGASPAECNASIAASLDSRGFFCADTLHITEAGKVCGTFATPSAAKAAAELKEAEAKAGPRRTNTPVIVATVLFLGVLGAWCGFSK